MAMLAIEQISRHADVERRRDRELARQQEMWGAPKIVKKMAGKR